jgi:hypothetical protein
MLEIREHGLPEIFKPFAIGFAGFAKQQDFKARITLTIVGGDLGQEPVRFAAAPSAAEANVGGAIGEIAETSSGTGGVLAGLEDKASAGVVFELVRRATEAEGFGEDLVEGGKVSHSEYGLIGKIGWVREPEAIMDQLLDAAGQFGVFTNRRDDVQVHEITMVVIKKRLGGIFQDSLHDIRLDTKVIRSSPEAVIGSPSERHGQNTRPTACANEPGLIKNAVLSGDGTFVGKDDLFHGSM